MLHTFGVLSAMGTLSSWVSLKKLPLPDGYRSIHVGNQCQMKCKSCVRVCPVQLFRMIAEGMKWLSVSGLHQVCEACGGLSGENYGI